MAAARRSDCPIGFALDCFGDRWTLLVIRDLLFKGKRRFQDFRRSEERIASNILAERLRALESAGIVDRHVAARNEGGVTYCLTTKGIDLAPVLVEMIIWSAQYDARTAADPEFVAAARADRNALLDAIAATYRADQGRDFATS
ncbi:MAG TPA: helix-turn-helix domain-containing protein [Mycobacteriales bacterium]|nr:helix-turn-helix domain-containing protein [Mycobacteriales bacterium]